MVGNRLVQAFSSMTHLLEAAMPHLLRISILHLPQPAGLHQNHQEIHLPKWFLSSFWHCDSSDLDEQLS